MIRAQQARPPRSLLGTAFSVTICALVLASSACPDTGDQPLVSNVEQRGPEVVLPPPPPGLLAHLRVGPLPRVLDDMAAVGRRLGAWDLGPGEVWPLLKELVGATTDLADIVDWRRAVHVLILDPASGPGGLAFILPVRHPDRALGRLSGRCRALRQGSHWVFTGGGRGLVPCRFVARTLEGGLVVAPHLSTLQRLWRFALVTAQQDLGGGPALEVRIFAKAGLAKLGLNAQKMDQLAKVGALGLAIAGGDLDAAPRIEAQLTRAFAYASSARDLGLAVHLGAQEVRVRLFATAQPKGALRRYIDDRHPAPLPDLAALPRRAPVTMSLASPAPSRRMNKAKGFEPGLLLSALLTQVPAALRKPLGRFASRLLGASGATRIALEPLDTGGLCLVALVDHPRPEQLGAAMHRDLTQGLSSLRKHLKLRGGAKTLTTPGKRAAGPVQIQDIELGGKWPASSLGLGLGLKWISGGDTLRMATATHGHQLVVALGARADHHVRAVLRRLKNPSRSSRPGPVLPAQRLGRIRLSLVELVRAVPILGAGMTLPRTVTGRLDLHWGVDPTRHQVGATLHLPLAHLVASAPFWQWLIDKLEAQTKGLSSLAPAAGPEPEDAL